jgi:hypothetical protein
MLDPFDPDGLLVLDRPREGEIRSKTKKALELVAEHGVDPKDALTLVHGRQLAGSSVKAFRRKAAQYSLTRPAMVKLAHDVVKNTLSGQVDTYTTQKLHRDGTVMTVTETLVPTHTNKLAAAAMVFDRAEPVIRQNVNLNGDLKDFLPVMLDDFS